MFSSNLNDNIKRSERKILKPGFHMIIRIVPVISKNAQTIATIIWKRYPDDRK